MKNMFKITIAAVLGASLGLTAGAASFRPLDTAEAARWGATHVATVSHADISSTNTVVIQEGVTNGVIPAGNVVVPVALLVSTPFNINSATTNAFNSTRLSVGDASDAAQFLALTQVNGNGTNATIIIPPVGAGGTVAVTVQTGALTATNGLVLPAQIVTNATAAFTAAASGSPGPKYYTSAGALTFNFEGKTNSALSTLDRGEVSFYIKMFKP